MKKPKIYVGEPYQTKGKGIALVTGYDPTLKMYKVLYSGGKEDLVTEYGLASFIDNINASAYDLILPEPTFEEYDEIQEWFQSEIGDDDLTPDEQIIKDLHNSRKSHAIDFAKWIAKEWMSMWVVDKWLWENVSVDTNEQSNWTGYYTEEQLYELYLKETI